MNYKVVVTIISAVVAVLVHFPELISMLDYGSGLHPFGTIRFSDVMCEVGFLFLTLLFLFWLNTLMFKFNHVQLKIKWQWLVLSFLITWGMNSLLGHLFVLLHTYLDLPAIDATLHHYLHPLRDFIISCVVTGGSYIIYLINRQQLILIENQELRTENLRNQYETLKNQLNPHMFFNSLNTLNTLIRESAEKAQNYTCELSKVLRYTLQTTEAQGVTLSQEMDFVKGYTYLLKTRYEENLNFKIEIDADCLSCYLPPMAVQMLVENAVKHNEISNKKPLLITIKTENGCVVVTNPIHLKISNTQGDGIGLRNLNKRYELLFRKEIAITIDDENYTVVLPLIKQEEYERINH